MAIQWADDFTRYGTSTASNTAMKDGLPYNNWLGECIADPDPLASGSRCATTLQNSINVLTENRIALPTTHAGTVGVAGRYWFPEIGNGADRQNICWYSTATPTSLARLSVEANGALSIYDGSDNQLATTPGPVISTNSWNHVEMAYNGTTGDIEVRLNGVTILTGTSPTTGTIAFVGPTCKTGSTVERGLYFKDLVVWDDTGATNNNFFGTVQCLRRKPVEDVTLGGWVPSTGLTGYDLLAKDAVNDSTYLSGDDAPPAAMEYELEDLPLDTTSVRGIVTVVRARKVDGGDANLQVSMLSNGQADSGADRPITTAYAYYFDISQLNPDTGLPWTPQEFDDATSEIDRTA